VCDAGGRLVGGLQGGTLQALKPRRCVACSLFWAALVLGIAGSLASVLVMFAPNMTQAGSNTDMRVLYALRSAVMHYTPSTRDQSSCRRVLILKQGRSGSSFLTDLIQSQPGVFVLEEIGVPLHVSTIEFEDYLTSSLRRCLLGYPRVVGATLDVGALDRHHNLRLDHVIQRVGHPVAVVVLRRTNVAKHAISLMRGARLQEKCHGANRVRGGQCKIGRIGIHPPRFLGTLLKLRQSHGTLLALSRQVNDSAAVTTVAYEELQQDRQATLRRIFEAIGAPELPSTAKKSRYAKNTNDDLRQAVTNLGKVQDALKDVPCVVQMLNSTQPRTFTGYQDCLERLTRCRVYYTDGNLHSRIYNHIQC